MSTKVTQNIATQQAAPWTARPSSGNSSWNIGCPDKWRGLLSPREVQNSLEEETLFCHCLVALRIFIVQAATWSKRRKSSGSH
mmetsp:Transcript_28047/g.64683  ORF Transcript_28047/g.64683 Transcript_28047/m.64683 type:complete len:83 (+) Transcript_28047:38-286(+)